MQSILSMTAEEVKKVFKSIIHHSANRLVSNCPNFIRVRIIIIRVIKIMIALFRVHLIRYHLTHFIAIRFSIAIKVYNLLCITNAVLHKITSNSAKRTKESSCN